MATTMKSVAVSALLLLCLQAGTHAFATGQVATHVKQPDSDPAAREFPYALPTSTTPRCGGVLRDVNSAIWYNLFDSVSDNERCVWIVAAPNASAYEVEVFFGTADASQQTVTVAGITKSSTTVQHVLPAGSGVLGRITANILVITFQTGSNNNATGFTLRATRTSTTTISSSSRYEILESSNTAGYVLTQHPVADSSYSNNELSAFVYPPTNNVADGRVRHVVFEEIGLESNYDYVTVHVFDAVSRTYEYRGSITSGRAPLPISSSDIVLLVFHTDSSVVRGGFYLASFLDNC